VVVVNWNRRALLEACLRSLAGQLGVSFDVVLVDNGSTDGSVEAAEQFANNSSFRLQLIRNNENRGFCAANNQGIGISRGEWIALLNNDAEADPGWLSSMLEAGSKDPGVGMVASKILVYENPAVIDKVGHLIYPDGQNRGRGTGELDRGQYDREEEVLWPDGCAALYRRTMLDQIGGFDEDLFAYGDDAELGLRARIAGWTCIYTPRAVVRHHRGATLGKMSVRRLALIERNRVLLAVKHFPLSLLALNVPYFVMRLAAGVLAGARGRGESGRFPGLSGKLRIAAGLMLGFASALLLIPRTIRKRQALQPLRRLSPKDTKNLLLQHQISLRTLSEGVA
jgi:GT2 family glycosyltransferase